MSDEEDEKQSRRKAPVEAKIHDDMDTLQKRAKEVEGLLAKSNPKDSVVVAIADPPLGSKNDSAKDLNFKTVMRALTSVKDADIPEVIKKVNATHGQFGVDNLMKYVCRGLSEAESCATLLKWHASIVEFSGLGPIVRVMTDRRGV